MGKGKRTEMGKCSQTAEAWPNAQQYRMEYARDTQLRLSPFVRRSRGTDHPATAKTALSTSAQPSAENGIEPRIITQVDLI